MQIEGARGASVSALPPRAMTLLDYVRAADEAALRGDLHAVRRALAMVTELARAGVSNSERSDGSVSEIRTRWSDPQYCERTRDEEDVHALLARIDALELQAVGVRR